MIKMSRKAKKAMAVALTAGMLASTAATPVMAGTEGWKKNSKGWWYEYSDGSYVKSDWKKVNGSWYYFDASGYMATGWRDVNGSWYYLTESGAMFGGGWKKINNKWYFFNNSGAMQSGLINVDGQIFYLGASNDGSMKTGTVTIGGVDYTFDETNGHCTNEKTPVATSKFDKTGKLQEEKVEVEEVDGIVAEVIDVLPEFQEKYGNIVMTDDDITIKVKVTSNGKPVAGTAVSLKLKCEVGPDVYEVKGLRADDTDANGYAYFVIGHEDDDVTVTTGDATLYSYTAVAVATGEKCEGSFGFAKVNMGEIAVNPGTSDKLAMSTNAKKNDTSIVATKGMDGKTVNKYVKSQQVNLPNSANHEITFSINPTIVIPVKGENDVVGNYVNTINQTLGEYSVYENNELWIENVPAGLQYATLNFDKIDISEHTEVRIESYRAGKKNDPKHLLGTTVISGPMNSNKEEQLPIQDDEAIDIKVAIISQGQVDDDNNSGVVVKDIVGVYKKESGSSTVTEPLSDIVTWETVEISYDNEKPLTFDQAKKYLPSDTETYGTYISDKNTYSYQVPVFPAVGNAIITVKDSNKKVLGYFTVPAVNNGKNVNVLATAANQAILVTKDEAFNKVGTITPNGNSVTVNSSETGVTALRAVLSNYADKDFDLTNDKVYASVHWSPIPVEEAVKEEDQFYALTGQTITVKAQLVDKAGNRVSKAGTPVTFSAGSTEIDENTTIIGNLVEVVSVSDTTDENGRATLIVKATDMQAVVESLCADSNDSKYDVVLDIKDQQVEKATLRWVTPGLQFTPATDGVTDKVSTLKDQTITADTLTSAKANYIDTYLTKDVGSQWILGYTVVGDTEDSKKANPDYRYVSSIEGLKVNITDNNDDATLTTAGLKNGAAKITTNKAGVAKVTGEIDETSLVAGTEVKFTVVTDGNAKTYTNVGEGTPFFEEEVALTLPVVFGTVGTNLQVVSPKGGNIDTSAESETVYVKVSDSLGNKIEDGKLKKLTINYTVINGTTTESRKHELTDDALTIKDGIVAVDVKKVYDSLNVKKATVIAEYENQTANVTISFVEAEGVFVLQNANYEKATKQVTLTFSQKVSNLVDDMITVVNEKGVAQEITNVKANGNKVTFTVADGINAENVYYVNIAKDQKIDGIDYSLCDNYGRALDDSNVSVVLTATAANLKGSYDATKGGIVFTVNSLTYKDDEILCVTDEGFKFTVNGVYAIAKTNEKQTVKCYYNGAYVSVDVPALTAEEITAIAKQEAQDELNDAVAELTNFDVTYTVATAVTFTTIPECEITSVVVSAETANRIFADNSGATTLKTVDDLSSVTGADACKVTVTYKNSTYSDVTQTVVYNVTTNATDKINFAVAQ